MRSCSILFCVAAALGCDAAPRPHREAPPTVIAPLLPSDTQGLSVWFRGALPEAREDVSRFRGICAYAFLPDAAGGDVAVELDRDAEPRINNCGTLPNVREWAFGSSREGAVEDLAFCICGSLSPCFAESPCLDEEGYLRPGRYGLHVTVDGGTGTGTAPIVLR